LILRAFQIEDAKTVQQLAGDYEVAKTTLSLPYPYPDGAAETWINFRKDAAKNGHGYTFAVVRKLDDALLGCISLNLTSQHSRGELGYWLGRRYWGQGYMTEAAREVLKFGFSSLGLNRIWAAAMTSNPASSAVMAKIGMKREGTFRQHIIKWGTPHDVDYYGMTKADYMAKQTG
jgi:RimJ/RimL family protein N-acetyltransferase